MERRVLAQEGELHRVLAEARRNAVIETNRLQALHAEVLTHVTTYSYYITCTNAITCTIFTMPTDVQQRHLVFAILTLTVAIWQRSALLRTSTK
jgi:hexokinase